MVTGPLAHSLTIKGHMGHGGAPGATRSQAVRPGPVQVPDGG